MDKDGGEGSAVCVCVCVRARSCVGVRVCAGVRVYGEPHHTMAIGPEVKQLSTLGAHLHAAGRWHGQAGGGVHPRRVP